MAFGLGLAITISIAPPQASTSVVKIYHSEITKNIHFTHAKMHNAVKYMYVSSSLSLESEATSGKSFTAAYPMAQ
jgi:hypothetical protein